MTTVIRKKHGKSIERIVSALQANPPRIRVALPELRKVFERSGEQPPAILAACAALLKTDKATTGDVLHAVRTAATEWDSYGEQERDLFRACVHTSQTRRTVAVSSAAEVTAMLRENPPRISDALNALRWLDAVTTGEHRQTFTACANLLKTPSATHPTVVDAITTGHRLWPDLTTHHRTLFTTCVYASKERATAARARTTARAKQNEQESGDIHRCGNCDGNLAASPELDYCSEFCRREVETSTLPELAPAGQRPGDTKTATAPARVPAEQRARETYVIGELETQYDEHFREVTRAIPSAGMVRKDERTVDHYEDERNRAADRDPGHFDGTDLTGHPVSEDDHERLTLRPFAHNALCPSCNVERASSEYLSVRRVDIRCALCREGDVPPLHTLAPTRELAAVA